MHEALAPGDALRAATRVMLKSIVDLFDLNQAPDLDNVIGLFTWTRNIVTRASTDAIFGAEKNPFQDAAVCDGFWYVIV